MKIKRGYTLYTHDVTHCNVKECEMYGKCYRAWLNENMLGHGWTNAWYLKPETIGKDCKYYLDIKDFET